MKSLNDILQEIHRFSKFGKIHFHTGWYSNILSIHITNDGAIHLNFFNKNRYWTEVYTTHFFINNSIECIIDHIFGNSHIILKSKLYKLVSNE